MTNTTSAGSGHTTTTNGSTPGTPAPVTPTWVDVAGSPGQGTYARQAVTCLSKSFCMYTDSKQYYATWNGTAWSPLKLIDPAFGQSFSLVMAPSCPAINFCMTVASMVSSSEFPTGLHNTYTWNGSTWTKLPEEQALPVGAYDLECVTATFCMAGAGYVYRWNGSTWSATDLYPSTGIRRLSCPTVSFCMGVGLESNVNVWNGVSWTQLTGVTASLDDSTDLRCTSSSYCLVRTNDYHPSLTTWNGSTWSAPVSPLADATSLYVSCALATFCVSVGSVPGTVREIRQASAVWDGATWSGRVKVGALGEDGDFSAYVTGVSCPNPSFCMAIDSYNHTATWSGGVAGR